jgi:hypothetical protein
LGRDSLPHGKTHERRSAGWVFGLVQWDGSGADRKLTFSAKSPTGASVYIACHETDVADKLQALLDSNHSRKISSRTGSNARQPEDFSN